MSAQLATASAVFSYQGASVTLACGSPEELKAALATFGVGQAANEPVTTKPAVATPAEKPQAQPAGNASASTGTQASAQGATGGSAASAETPTYTYDQVAQRVKDLCKKTGGREKCLALLATFKAVSGQPVDHGNKLQLPDYASFIAQADALIGAAA